MITQAKSKFLLSVAGSPETLSSLLSFLFYMLSFFIIHPYNLCRHTRELTLRPTDWVAKQLTWVSHTKSLHICLEQNVSGRKEHARYFKCDGKFWLWWCGVLCLLPSVSLPVTFPARWVKRVEMRITRLCVILQYDHQIVAFRPE